MKPQFHFTAASGWINDPHGITYRNGGYDVFYQHVPGSTVWQPNCHWGHAHGQDLFSLRELPVAIAPGDGDDGIWTGSLVVDGHHRARAFYTAVHIPEFGIGHIREATPNDPEWVDWYKGPVVAEAPEELDLIAFRDPFVRREGAVWRMFVGAAGRDGTAMALTYVSDNQMATWRYDGVTLARSTHETDPVWTGALWECPQFFPIQDRHAMVTSVWDADNLHYVVYALGSYANGRFEAEAWGRLTHGPSYYAPSLFIDANQRPCLTFWMRGIADPEGSWAGAHSIPHVLTLHDERLVAAPHPDIEPYQCEPDETDPRGNHGLDITWGTAPGAALEVRRGTDPIAAIHCRTTEIKIQVWNGEWTMPSGDELRIILDGPVLELSTTTGNFGTAIPTPAGELSIHATGATPVIRNLVRTDVPMVTSPLL